jgi:hypothetical protein
VAFWYFGGLLTTRLLVLVQFVVRGSSPFDRAGSKNLFVFVIGRISARIICISSATLVASNRIILVDHRGASESSCYTPIGGGKNLCTEVLIKERGPMKHISLKEDKQVWLRALVSS